MRTLDLTKKDNTTQLSIKEIRKILSMVPNEFTFSMLEEKMNKRKILGEIPETTVRGRIQYIKKMRVIYTDGSKSSSGERIYKKSDLYKKHRKSKPRRRKNS